MYPYAGDNPYTTLDNTEPSWGGVLNRNSKADQWVCMCVAGLDPWFAMGTQRALVDGPCQGLGAHGPRRNTKNVLYVGGNVESVTLTTLGTPSTDW